MSENGNAVTGEVVDRPQQQEQRSMTVRDLLAGSKAKAMAAVCTNALTAEKIVKLFALAASRTPLLLQCTPVSVANAMMQCSELGIAPGTLGTAYPIPFYNGAAKAYECQLIIGYRGLVELARRSGQVSTITAGVVREGDHFEYEDGIDPILRHRPTAPLSAKRTHAWAAVKFKDGSFQTAVLRWEEVERVRACSKAGNSGPWAKHTDEMAKKTALRRLCKLLPLTPDVAEKIEQVETTEFDMSDIAAANEQAEQQALGVEATKAALKAQAQQEAQPAAEQTTPEPEAKPAAAKGGKKSKGDASAEPGPDWEPGQDG